MSGISLLVQLTSQAALDAPSGGLIGRDVVLAVLGFAVLFVAFGLRPQDPGGGCGSCDGGSCGTGSCAFVPPESSREEAP
jgi:hypothetical protein